MKEELKLDSLKLLLQFYENQIKEYEAMGGINNPTFSELKEEIKKTRLTIKSYFEPETIV